jgi:putative FmdB family regulatory protein
MPIYEYKCSKCGKITELLNRKRSERDRTFLCGCGKGIAQRVEISLPGFRRDQTMVNP